MNEYEHFIFPLSLPTTPRIVSFLPPLPLGATPASQMGMQVVQKSQVQRLRLRNADLCCCWIEIGDEPNITSGYWSLRLPGWNEIHRYTLWLRLSYNKLRQRSKHTHAMWILMVLPNKPQKTPVNPVSVTRKVHHSIGVSATAVQQYPTWNNQRWFFDVLLCHRKSRSHGFWASQLVCLKKQVKSECPQFWRFQLLSPR